MAEDGASVAEQLIGAARSNNEAILEQLLQQGAGSDAAARADLINHTRDPVGNTLLHVAAANGNLEVLDFLLDQELVEIDPRDRLGGNTPLHTAVKLANKDEAAATELVSLLVECGADVRLKDGQGRSPLDLARGHPPVISILRGAVYAAESMDGHSGEFANGGDESGDDVGSESESD